MLNCAEEFLPLRFIGSTVYFNLVYKENHLLSKTIYRQNFDYSSILESLITLTFVEETQFYVKL